MWYSEQKRLCFKKFEKVSHNNPFKQQSMCKVTYRNIVQYSSQNIVRIVRFALNEKKNFFKYIFSSEMLIKFLNQTQADATSKEGNHLKIRKSN